MERRTRRDQQATLVYQLLYHNLGGELIYILNQRLVAQKISKEKANQVLVDVMTNFVNSRNYWLRTFVSCSDRVLDSLSLKIPFESVISSSPIMKLTPASYDKLYDLMIGVFKYQLCQAPLPSSLYFITLNHVNSLLDLASEIGPGIRNVVKGLQDDFVHQFSTLTKFQWSILRDIILSNSLIDIKTRVSILIREMKQDMETGFFVIPVPTSPGNPYNGRITHYQEQGQVIREDGVFCETVSEMTTLGLDIYSSESEEKNEKPDQEKRDNFQMNGGRETSLLANLLGAKSRPASSIALHFEFKEEDRGEDGASSSTKSEEGQGLGVHLSQTVVRAEKFDLETRDYEDGPVDGDELLALMDS